MQFHFTEELALATDQRSWTYKELDEEIDKVCKTLLQQGVKRGQIVPFSAERTAQTIFLLFALFRIQAIACPLSTRLPPQALQQALQEVQGEIPVGATLLFTSGSTGLPKMALHSLDNYLYSVQGSLPLQPGDRWHLSLPLYHVGGLAILFRCFCAGATVLISDKYDQATHLSLVPTQLERILKTKLPKLKAILLGGAPIPPHLLLSDLPLFPSYGMTEMTSTITLSHDRSSLGFALPHRSVHIDAHKEIWVSGKTLFLGYWNKEKGLLTPQDPFPTGDLGEWTPGGLRFLGRKDNLFISGGENIQPEEIENALLALEGIKQAIVVPVPDREFGFRPVAFLDPMLPVEDGLRKALPSFKIPKLYFPLPSSDLKPSRRDLINFLAQKGLA